MIEFAKITDRYGKTLENPNKLPTVEQSVLSWALVNELLKIGYCNNFQHEREDIVAYIYAISSAIDKAKRIVDEVTGNGK